MNAKPLPDYMEKHREWINEQVRLLQTIKQHKTYFGMYHRDIDKAIQAIAAAEKAIGGVVQQQSVLVGGVVQQQGVLVGGDIGTPQTRADREAIRQHINEVCPDDGLAAFNLGMNLDIAPILFAGMWQKLEEIKAVTPKPPSHNPSLFSEAYLYIQMQKYLTKPRRVSINGSVLIRSKAGKKEAFEIIKTIFELAGMKLPKPSTIRSKKR